MIDGILSIRSKSYSTVRSWFERFDVGLWGPGLLWGAVAYGIHKYGALAGFYLAYPWFQNLTHAASASGVAIIVGLVGLERGFRGRRLLSFVVAVTILAALGWEAIEYLGWLDQYGVYLMFHDINDAAVDMVSNFVGLGVALGLLWWWTGLDPSRVSERESAGKFSGRRLR